MPLIQNKHQLFARWTHWVNFPVLFVMIWSGLLIYWAHDPYRIGVGSVTLFKFFPQWFYALLHLDHRLAQGMAWHFYFMWFFALNGFLYVALTLATGHWREMIPHRNALQDAWQVTLHDLGLRRDCPPQGKYNAAQQMSYTAIIVMGAGSLITGLAIYRPIQLSWLTTSLGGYEWARAEHFTLTVGYVLFFLVHVIQVARAGWNNFRSMVAGYELVSSRERTPSAGD
jgi:thiosulfate reductase cytochrome b subunit